MAEYQINHQLTIMDDDLKQLCMTMEKKTLYNRISDIRLIATENGITCAMCNHAMASYCACSTLEEGVFNLYDRRSWLTSTLLILIVILSLAKLLFVLPSVAFIPPSLFYLFICIFSGYSPCAPRFARCHLLNWLSSVWNHQYCMIL